MRILFALSLTAAFSAVAAPNKPLKIGHPSFLSPHSRPIALHGDRVLVANAPADSSATTGTVELLRRLHAQSGRGVLFGHQDTVAYGVDWRGEANQSDIKDVCEKRPAV